MKTQSLKLLILLVLVLGTYLHTNAQEWYADPNISGSSTVNKARKSVRLFQNESCENQTQKGSLQISTNTGGITGKSWKIVSPKNVLRTEFSRTTGTVNNFVHKKNKNYYYSWRWRVNVSESSFDNSNDEVTVFQWKTEGSSGGSQNYPINMEYKKNTLTLNYFGPCKVNGQFKNWLTCKKPNGNQAFPSDRRKILKSITVGENQWVDIVLRIQRGANESGSGSGKVQLWINGTLQTLDGPNGTGKSITLKTDDADNQNITDSSVYPKWGIYNKKACKYNITTWTNELKIYDNWQDAVANLNAKTGPTKGSSSEDFTNNEVIKKSLLVYPNPITDEFSVKLQGITNADVTITNMLGKTIYKQSVNGNILNLRKGNLFTSGMYIVIAKDENNKMYTSKLVIK